MKGNIRLNFIVIAIFWGASSNAQMNRSAQASNITSTIYQNTSHSITGAALQQVMLNQNNSYVNLLSDTNLLDVRIFSPYATYTPGMGVFYNDTLYMNVETAHGTWTNADWIKINGSSCACSTLVKYSDTGTRVATLHDISVATNPLIAWADTGTGTGGTSKIATPHALSVATAPLIPFTDTGTGSKKVATSYNLSSYSTIVGLHDSLNKYQQIKDSNSRNGYATVYYVGSHGGGLSAGDTIGGGSHLGANSQIATNYSSAILGGQPTNGAFIIGTLDSHDIQFVNDGFNIADFSTTGFYLGYGSVAPGAEAIAMGRQCTANGMQSVCAGYESYAQGTDCVTLGYDNIITGNYSCGIGTGINSSTTNIFFIGSKSAPLVPSYDSATSQEGGTSVSGSVSGTAMFIQTQIGDHIKEVDVSLNALDGSASYTFPLAFSSVVDYIPYINAAAGAITVSLSKTAVTISVPAGTTSGFIEIKGY